MRGDGVAMVVLVLISYFVCSRLFVYIIVIMCL